MTNEQQRRLEEVIEKYNETAENRLSWWEVTNMIGDTSNRMRVETTIKAIKNMIKNGG